MNTNYDLIKYITIQDNIQAVALTETWLNENNVYVAREICPNGYTLLRADRNNRPGGGVGLLCNEALKPKVLPSEEYESFEHIFVSLQSGLDKIRILVLYRPPSSSSVTFISEFSSLLEEISLGGLPLLLMGDFNVPWDNANNSFTRRFRDTLFAFGLDQHVDQATHVKGHILDLVISRESDCTKISNINIGNLVSDHNIISFGVSFPEPKKEKRDISYRDISAIDMDKFRLSLVESTLVNHYMEYDLDFLVEAYNRDLSNILDQHAPLISKQVPVKRREPWYDHDGITEARRTSRAHERRFRKNGDESEKQLCDDAFMEWRALLEQSKRDHLSKVVDDNRQDSKKLFQTMNKLMNNRKSNPLPDYESPEELANEFSSFFKSKIDKIRLDFSNEVDNAFRFDVSNVTCPLEAFKEVSLDDVRIMIDKSKDKFCDLDPLPTTLVKQCSDLLSPIIARIINLSLQTSTMPCVYKTAIVKPLLKKPSLDRIASNYRPVSNLPYISKLIEESVIRQLSSHMVINGLGEVLQSAYKTGHSTETALTKVFDDICKSLNDNRAVYMAMLDLSAAFDTVDHRILLQRLDSLLGIRGCALEWFVSYLSDRYMQVVVANAKSEPVLLDCSVPQGSQLGPKLYNDYTLPLGVLVRILLIIFHFYADDSQLLRISSLHEHDQREAVGHLERCVSEIGQWMTDNKLKLNPTKTEFIVITSARNQAKIVTDSLTLDNSVIPRSDTIRNLGVVMDSNLDMKAHVAQIRKMCYFYISWIKRIRPFLSREDAKSLIHSLVISRLDYCNGLLYGLPDYLIHDLQVVMNDAARIVVGIKRDPTISITDVLKDLHWLPIKERSIFKILTMVYKGLHGLAPQYITELLLVKPVPSHSLRNYDSLKLILPKAKNKSGERAFSYSGPKLWNSIPFQIRNEQTFSGFKRALKTYLFRSCYNC